MGSASRNMNLMECLILLSIVSIVLIWILQAHFFVASCVAFSCRWGIDFICKALMTSIWPGSMRNSILSWYMRWHLGLQMMADKLWSQQVGGWSEGEVLCVQQLGGRWICSPEPSRHFCWVHAEIFELPSLLKLKESRYRRGAARLICEGLRVVFIFNLAPFSLCPSQHTASPPSFAKSQLRAVLKARSGSEVTLECKPQASPPAISLWKKGNEILQRTER